MAGSVVANDDRQAALVELRKTKETAERVANGESQDGADNVRVLAGMIHQLAEQVERLAASSAEAPMDDRPGDNQSPNEAEAPLEEDRTPEDAPAEPLNDRAKA